MLAIRLIAIVLLAYLVLCIIDMLLSSGKTTNLMRKRAQRETGEKLILCLQCQGYVPEAEAVFSRGNYFCREECARLFMQSA